MVDLDFGFLARRPRIHEIGYALAFMLLALDGHHDPARFWGHLVPLMIGAYEATAPTPLTAAEREALPAYTASVPLYFAALAGFNSDPVCQLRAYQPFLRLGEWLL